MIEFKNDILLNSNSLTRNIGNSTITSSINLVSNIFDYISDQRFKALVVRSYLILFAAVLGSVGTILLYNQNELIRDQNKMLLKQYEGFQEQLSAQVNRWKTEDDIK